MDHSRNYWTAIRVFHILLGSLLAYAGYQHSQGKKLPNSFYQLILALGLGAVAYHGYKLAQLQGLIN
jgi:hypothetical protein